MSCHHGSAGSVKTWERLINAPEIGVTRVYLGDWQRYEMGLPSKVAIGDPGRLLLVSGPKTFARDRRMPTQLRIAYMSILDAPTWLVSTTTRPRPGNARRGPISSGSPKPLIGILSQKLSRILSGIALTISVAMHAELAGSV